MIMNAATLDVSAPSEGMLQLILAQAVSPGHERDRGDRRSEDHHGDHWICEFCVQQTRLATTRQLRFLAEQHPIG
jgi:hypothetical protein